MSEVTLQVVLLEQDTSTIAAISNMYLQFDNVLYYFPHFLFEEVHGFLVVSLAVAVVGGEHDLR